MVDGCCGHSEWPHHSRHYLKAGALNLRVGRIRTFLTDVKGISTYTLSWYTSSAKRTRRSASQKRRICTKRTRIFGRGILRFTAAA